MNVDYQKFIESKAQSASYGGFDPVFMPDFMFDFQSAIVDWAVRKGRAAIFADCGLGKTPMQLVWGQNIVMHTNRPVLILTPLAVASQTEREAAKFGIEARQSRDGNVSAKITISNYEQLHKFNPDDFAGVVCDESSILKSFDGSRRNEITRFMRKVQYRLLATATAAPNDYTELGTSSEALGYLGHIDMLNRFFKNDNNNTSTKRMYGEAPKWRFAGHSEIPFWRWVTSWAKAIRKPSDIGFDDGRFILPNLEEVTHLVETEKAPSGMLFSLPATTLIEQRDERKRTISERCEMAAKLADHDIPVILWCHLNQEGDLLEKLIPESVQVSGSDSDDKKEAKLSGFANGDFRALITKPKIGAWGLNFQHCHKIVYFPSHSYEQYYQAVRRCWRFGQDNPVDVDIVMTEGERRVMENLKRKSVLADEMFSRLVAEMNNSESIKKVNKFTKEGIIPSWL